jgi:dTDP-4-dehydrorhamnose reductase
MNDTHAHERGEITSASKRILLLGSTGQVGFELHRSLAPMGELITPTRNEVDLTNPDALRSLMATVRPDLIVNAAAWTAVDAAEGQPEEALAVNARLPGMLAEYAADHGIWMVHYSTDYVYPGTGDRPWRETDSTEPLSVYGQTKLKGDLAIKASGVRHLIFRTSWVYSARGGNFMNTMLRLGAERNTLKVVSDQIGAPTPARLIAEITLLALQGRHRGPFIDSGVYHLAPRGETSWHGFARAIFEHAVRCGAELAISPASVVDISTKEWPTPATRPLNSRLSLERIERALGIRMPHWEKQLALTLAELNVEI